MSLVREYLQLGLCLFAPSTALALIAMAVALARRSTPRLRYAFLSLGVFSGYYWLAEGLDVALAVSPLPPYRGGGYDLRELGIAFFVWPGAVLALITTIVSTYLLERGERRRACPSCGGAEESDVSELGVGRSVG